MNCSHNAAREAERIEELHEKICAAGIDPASDAGRRLRRKMERAGLPLCLAATRAGQDAAALATARVDGANSTAVGPRGQRHPRARHGHSRISSAGAEFRDQYARARARVMESGPRERKGHELQVFDAERSARTRYESG